MTALLFAASMAAGVVIYANFWSCDPIKEGLIESRDEIATLFVTSSLNKIPGLPGVFIAALLGGALRYSGRQLYPRSDTLDFNFIESYGLSELI